MKKYKKSLKFKYMYKFLGELLVRHSLVLLDKTGSHSKHYVNVSVLIKFSQNASVFTLIIISSP